MWSGSPYAPPLMGSAALVEQGVEIGCVELVELRYGDALPHYQRLLVRVHLLLEWCSGGDWVEDVIARFNPLPEVG